MSVYDWERASRRRHGIPRPSPFFLAVVAVAAVGGVLAWVETQPGSRLGDFGVFLLVLGGWVISVCFHEFAHAYVAFRSGDRSVEARGYLTLNPFAYTHPALSILFPLIALISGGFALPGGAVYLHPHAFRTKAQRSLAAGVGPLVNVVLAVVLTQIARTHENDASHPRFWYGLAFLGVLQIIAALLNLLPVPGLDGWAIIEPYLSPETVRGAEKIKPWGLLIVIALLLWADPVRNTFFDLTDWIYGLIGGSDALHYLGYAFFKFWTKNPL